MGPASRALACVALVACSGAKGLPADEPVAVETTDTTPSIPPPCAGGTWGGITDPDASIHVSPSGDDAGDGSVASPLATVSAAIERARQPGGALRVAIWPGSYTESLLVGPNLDDGAPFDDLQVEGCSSAEVSIGSSDAGLPTLWVSQVSGVGVAGLTLEGGTEGLRVQHLDPEAQAALVASDLSVEGMIAGVLVDGPILISLRSVTVADRGRGLGFGIAAVDGADVSLAEVEVRGATSAGVFIDGATLSASSLLVEGTVPDTEGRFGRAVHAQLNAEVTLSDSTLLDSSDAGFFALSAANVTLSGVTVDGVAAGIADDGSTTGDAIVVSAGGNFNPADFPATISGCTVPVNGAQRSGIYLEDVSATLDGNTIDGSFGDYALVADPEAFVVGAEPFLELLPIAASAIIVPEVGP